MLTFFFVVPLFSQDRCLVNIGNKFEILIGNLNEDAKKIGLTEERLRTVTELRLRKEGMDIKNASTNLNMPYVCVTITVVGAAFGIDLRIKEVVEIQRKPLPVFCTTSTWGASSIGTHIGDPEFIVSGLSQLLDEFLNDYYKANPKKRGEE